MQELVQAFGGLLSIVVLLTLLVVHVVHPGVAVSPEIIGLLLALIGALLGVNIGTEQIPAIRISLEDNDDGEIDDD